MSVKCPMALSQDLKNGKFSILKNVPKIGQIYKIQKIITLALIILQTWFWCLFNQKDELFSEMQIILLFLQIPQITLEYLVQGSQGSGLSPNKDL